MTVLRVLALTIGSVIHAGIVPAGLADDSSSLRSFTVAAVTDYVSRGVSYNDNSPALQASVDYSGSRGLYAGIWTSNYDFDSPADREFDVYVGFASTFNESAGFDAGVAGYFFRDERGSDYQEIYAGISLGAGDLRAWYTDDYFGTGGSASYLEGGFSLPMPANTSLSVRAGRSSFEMRAGARDYTDYMIALRGSLKGFDLDLRVTATDGDQYGDREDGRVVFSAGKTVFW